MFARAVRSVAVLLVLFGVVATGCTPAPDPAPTPVPMRGCYDNLHPGVSDVYYTGEPSEFDNLEWWTSTDGSCTGNLIGGSTPRSTLIAAANPESADVLCRMLLDRTLVGTMDRVTGPWSPSFGPGAYSCTA